MKDVSALLRKTLRPAKRWIRQKLWKQPEPTCPSLLAKQSEPGPTVWHVALFGTSNAGDVLLPVTLRDLFSSLAGPISWRGQHVHNVVDARTLKAFNNSSGMIIGGGGLFLRDTNPNQLSGWQWSCSTKMLEQIRVPIAIFAVGYNRFRGQPDFAPVFRKHLGLLAEKSVYLGLRNQGSIRALQNYLPESAHGKLVYQPCMTTLLTRIYPERFQQEITGEPFIALNCAFDRVSLRFGPEGEKVQQRIANALAKLNRDYAIKYYSHLEGDKAILPVLDAAGVQYEVVDLAGAAPETIIEAYRQPLLTLGMRGHAQLIPFGCQTPLLSLISHDKLRWFLEDIDALDWGVEIEDPDSDEQIVQIAQRILENREEVRLRLQQAQDKLWQISTENVQRLQRAMLPSDTFIQSDVNS